MIEKILYFFRVRKEKSTNKKLFYSVKKKYKYFFERKLLNIRKIFNPFYFWFWRWLFSLKKLASKIVMQNWKRMILAKEIQNIEMKIFYTSLRFRMNLL